MIKFEKRDKKEYSVLRDGQLVIDLDLVSSSVTNKFEVIVEFIEDISLTLKNRFDDWFCNFLTTYKNNQHTRFQIVTSQVPRIKEFCNEYITLKNVDYSKFVNHSKVKKSSIVFESDEIKKILQLSSYFKLYALISNTSLKLDDRLHKKVFNEILGTENNQVVYKIFEIVRTKTYSYNLSDWFMWVYLDTVQGKEIDAHIIEIFNFIMSNILVLCKLDKNPITFFVTVIDTSIRWLLRSVYKVTVMYEDDMSNADIQTVRLDSLKSYTSKDTLARLKGVSINYIHSLIEQESTMFNKDVDVEITKFQTRVSKIDKISPITELVVYPILSKVTNISYSDFLTLTPEYAAVISVYVKDILKKVFKSQFSTVFDMIDLYPATDVPVFTSYKIKNIQEFINISNSTGFFSFRTIPYPYKLISNFIGKITKISYYNVVSGESMTCLSTSKIESDCINFFLKLFSNQLDNDLKKVRSKLLVDF